MQWRAHSIMHVLVWTPSVLPVLSWLPRTSCGMIGRPSAVSVRRHSWTSLTHSTWLSPPHTWPTPLEFPLTYPCDANMYIDNNLIAQVEREFIVRKISCKSNDVCSEEILMILMDVMRKSC